MKKLFPNFFSCIFDVCYALANIFDVAVVLSDRRKFHFWRNTYDFKQFSIIFSAEIEFMKCCVLFCYKNVIKLNYTLIVQQ